MKAESEEKASAQVSSKAMNVVVIGDRASGKTQLADQMYTRSAVQPRASKMLDPKQNSIREVSLANNRDLFRIKSATVVIYAVDLTRPTEANDIKQRLFNTIERYTESNPKVIIVGTNGDLATEKEHTAYAAILRECAQEMGCSYEKVSSKTGVGVDAVLDQMLNPRIVEQAEPPVANRQASGIARSRKTETLEVTLSNLNVDADAAIKSTILANSAAQEGDELQTKWVDGKLQIGQGSKGEKAGQPIRVRATADNTITVKLIIPPKLEKQAQDYRKLFADQTADLVNKLNCGATVTINHDASRTLKPALEDRVTKSYEPEKKAVLIISGSEQFLQEFEKKGTAISSFAGGFADTNIADSIGLRQDQHGTEKLTAHMVESNSTLTIKIAPSEVNGERKVEIANDQLNGKGLKELVVVVNDMMDRCRAAAARVGELVIRDPVDGEVVQADPMENIRFNTDKSSPDVKGALDKALQKAGYAAQLQPREEQVEAKTTRPSMDK